MAEPSNYSVLPFKLSRKGLFERERENSEHFPSTTA